MKEIQEITIKDKNYPKKLLNISGVPKKLYCLGNISLLEKTFLEIEKEHLAKVEILGIY